MFYLHLLLLTIHYRINMLNKDTVLLSLDVEAGFLYDPSISYGYILGDIDGTVIEEDYQFSALDAVSLKYLEDSAK